MSSLRYIVSFLFCFGVLFAEDLTCIYSGENIVILSDNSSWDLLEDEAPFRQGEVVSIKKSEDDSVTYLVGENQTVVVEFDEVIPFEERQIRQAFPVEVRCSLASKDMVEKGGFNVSFVQMEEGDLMVFLSQRALMEMEEGNMDVIDGSESEQFLAGSSLIMAQNQYDKSWGALYSVTNSIFMGVRTGFVSNCTKRVFSHIEDGFMCFEDGSKIDFSVKTNTVATPAGANVESLEVAVFPLSLKMVISDPSMKMSIEGRGDRGLEFCMVIQSKDVMVDPSEEEEDDDSQLGEFGSDEITLTVAGSQQLADFFGWGVFEKGDVLNIYSFKMDKEIFINLFEDNPDFCEMLQNVDANPCYVFERVKE